MQKKTPEAELRELAQKIRDHQTARGDSDTAFVKRFGGLGSTKTYTSILNGEVDQLDLERWLQEYRQVWALIEALTASEETDEPIYDDLSPVTRLRIAVTDAMRERGNNRLVILQGPPGCGKSTATRALLERFGQRIVLAEADETWKDSLMAMLGGCLRALGVTVLPANSSERLRVLLEKLRERRVCLVIDESHHLGPRTLNIVKTIINQTPGEIVLSAQGTLFRRLELSAYEEARQLTQNRLAERVNLESVASADVELFLSRRLEWENGEIKQAAQLLGEKAQGRGQFAFAKRVCQQARRLARKEPITLELFTRALAKTEAAR